MTLLGRLVATAVQNMRTYEAERATVEELRRLAALRADFVSLVSHELRSPMAAVIGSARTLQQRWRELRPEQREAFLALIADETTRLVGADRRRARHLADRGGHVRLRVLGRRPRASSCASRWPPPRSARTRCGSRADLATSLPHVRGDARPAPPARRQPDRERGQVLAAGRRGARRRPAPTTGGVIVRVDDDGPGIPRRRAASRSSRSSAAPSAARSPAPGSASSSRARSPRRTAARSRSTRGPGEGAAFTLTLPLGS